MRHDPAPYATARAVAAAAFVEGRRLREQARARRTTAGGAPSRFAPVRRWLLLLVVLPLVLCGVLLTTGMLVALALLDVVPPEATLTPPALVAGGAALLAARRARRRRALRRGGAPGTAPLPARPAATRRPEDVWASARRRFHTLRAEYAAYECDAMAVLRLPALADVTVPSTARFVDAFAEAQALETDELPPHHAAFVSAVDRAERAWRAARDAADRIRLSALSPAERGTVERVIKLLTTARDSDNDAERLAAYARARTELAKLDHAGTIHVPLPATAAVEQAARGALPA